MSFIKKFGKINFRSIFLNFYLLPFSQAIHFPISVARNVKITSLYRGGVRLNSKRLKPAMIQIGYCNVGTIDSHTATTVIQIERGGCIVFYDTAKIGCGSSISIGKNAIIECKGIFNVTAKSSFISKNKIAFGDNVLVSWDCLFMDTDFHKIIQENSVVNKSKEIIVGNNTWICCRSTILKGAKIPDGSVIGAGSLFSSNFHEENCLYAGVPAKKIKENISWEI